MSGVWERIMRYLRRKADEHQAALPPHAEEAEGWVAPHTLDPIATHRELEAIAARDRETRQVLQAVARMQANADARRALHRQSPGPYP